MWGDPRWPSAATGRGAPAPVMLSEAKHLASLRHSARFFVAALLRMTGSGTAAARSMRAKHAARKIHRAQDPPRARSTGNKAHCAQGAPRVRCTAHKAHCAQGALRTRRTARKMHRAQGAPLARRTKGATRDSTHSIAPGPGAHPALAFAICRAGLSQASHAFAIHAPQGWPCTPRRAGSGMRPGWQI